MALKFRKKPVVISALRWDPNDAAAVGNMQKFLGNHYFNHGGLLRISTLEGVMEAHDGDWITRGVKDEYYPVKPDIFAATYEPVVDAPGPREDGQ